MSLVEQFLLGLIPGILGSIVAALQAGGKLPAPVLPIIQAIDASVDAVLVAVGLEKPEAPKA